MILTIESVLKRAIPERYHKRLGEIRNNYIRGYALDSYSQEGEDMILRRIFEKQETGFYVDVGAYHPKRFSNTYFFYKRGWSGINIDATPGIMAKFKKTRRRDINLNVGVSSVPGELTFYIFDDPAFNSFDAKLAKQRSENTSDKIKKVAKVKTTTLESIFSENLGSNRIDFVSVDVEGFELEVLQSNNWDKFRPEYLLVESLESGLSEIHECPIYKFLTERGYEAFAKTFQTFFYKDTAR